jgi:hypothetical protein
MGKNPNQSLAFNTFDLVTKNGYPTIKRCIDLSNDNYPNQREVILLSISEMKKEDFDKFISEQ